MGRKCELVKEVFMKIEKCEKGRTLYHVACDLILLDEKKVLLQHRVNTGWMNNMWNLVVGHCEDDETLEQAIVREVKEELGIEINVDDVEIVHCIQFKSNRLTMQFYAVCERYQGTPKVRAELVNGVEICKADKLEWFDIDNLPENIVPTVKHAIDNYLNGVSFSKFGF